MENKEGKLETGRGGIEEGRNIGNEKNGTRKNSLRERKEEIVSGDV